MVFQSVHLSEKYFYLSFNCSHWQDMDNIRQPGPLVADVFQPALLCWFNSLQASAALNFAPKPARLPCIGDQVLLNSSPCLKQGLNAPKPRLCIGKWTPSVHSHRDYKPNHAFHSLLDWIFGKYGTHGTSIVSILYNSRMVMQHWLMNICCLLHQH